MGFFFRFLLQGRKNLINSYLFFISIATAAYLVIPLSSLLLGDAVAGSFWLQQVLPGVGLLVFGFCQFPAWPTLLTLTNDHFNLDQEGAAMGIWSANGDLGNIIGFGLAGMLVDGLSCRWELAMLVAAGFHLVMAISVKLFLSEKTQNP
jgi:sugar phosphate permease